MKKISTLYKKNPNDLSQVTYELNPENEWVLLGEGIPTRKFDGTSVAIIQGELYKRYDVKPGKVVPDGAIPCQEPDEYTGHWPHWVKCDRNDPSNKYHFEAFDKLQNYYSSDDWFDKHIIDRLDGTYELCGEKIQSNPEKVKGHILIKHGSEVLPITDFSFYALKEYLANPENDIEGIVFHHKTDGRMCKIRKCDFNIKRHEK